MIKMIVAVDDKGGIGKEGKIPWHHPGDLKHFKEKTLNQVVIMGSKTFKSLDFKPLPKRHNFVLTLEGIRDIRDGSKLESIEDFMSTYSDFWVIGGNSVYKLFMPFAQEIHITRIEGDFDCDVFFPFKEMEENKDARIIEFNGGGK